MSWVLQLLYMALVAVGIVIALWIGIWILLALLVVGVGMVIWSHLRDYLLAKGILNPRPGVPMDGVIIEEQNTTIIEGDFKRVEESEPKE